MRSAQHAILLWLLPLIGSSQSGAWVHSADSIYFDDFFYDGAWNGERFLLSRQLVRVNATGTASQSKIHAVSEQGALVNSTTFNAQPRFVAGVLLPRFGTNESDFIATSQPSTERWRAERYGLDGLGHPIDTTLAAPDSLYNFYLENASRTIDGGIAVAFASSPVGTPFWFTRMLLLKLNAAGDSLSSFSYNYPFGSIYPYDIIERSPDTILIATDGGIEAAGTAFSITSISAVNHDLQPFAGMPMIVADGSGDPLGFFNSFTSRVHLLQLNGDTILVAGRMGTGGTGSRYGVMKVHWPTATWLGAYLPQSSYPADHPAVTQSTVLQDDGHVLVAYMENYQFNPSPYLPTAPNRLRIVRLDQDLNPLCTNVIDGFAENAYYLLYRIKPMPDGGYLLLGGRWDFNSPQPDFAAWARKLGPEECFTGVEESMATASAFAYPNPGHNEVRFTMNGPFRSTHVELFDAHGRLVGKGVLQHGQATLDSKALFSGMYFWRIVDMHGAPIASGKWLKE